MALILDKLITMTIDEVEVCTFHFRFYLRISLLTLSNVILMSSMYSFAIELWRILCFKGADVLNYYLGFAVVDVSFNSSENLGKYWTSFRSVGHGAG